MSDTAIEVHAHTLTVGDFIEFPEGYGEVVDVAEPISGHVRVDGRVDGVPVTYYLRRLSPVLSWTASKQPTSGSEQA